MTLMPRALRRLRRAAPALCLSACLAAGLASLPGCASHASAGPSGAELSAQDPWNQRTKEPTISADTFYAAGQLAESRDLWNQALKEYNKALAVNADHLPSLFREGVLYTRFKQYPEASAVWRHYLKASGGDATAYANLGFCCELSGQYDEAQFAYESGIRRDPLNAPCRVNFGLLLARRGKFEEAARQWRVVLSEAQVHYNLGSAYEFINHRAQARTEYSRALDLDPQLADARARLNALNGSPVGPATAPAVADAAGPTTEPAASAPATEPAVAEDASPTTEPTVAAAGPTTEPIAAAGPTTEPTVADLGPTTAPVADAGPTTAPTASADGVPLPGDDTPDFSEAGPAMKAPAQAAGPTTAPVASATESAPADDDGFPTAQEPSDLPTTEPTREAEAPTTAPSTRPTEDALAPTTLPTNLPNDTSADVSETPTH